MIYLLDANVLITAANLYYPLDAVPEFWAWLAYQAEIGNVKMPIETFEEVKDGGDDETKDMLYAWVQANKGALVLAGEVDSDAVQHVLDDGYGKNLTDLELEEIGRDPFLVAHGLADPANRIVVSTEATAPSKQRQNRRVPDVCKDLGVTPCDTFKMLRDLGFKTDWKPPNP